MENRASSSLFSQGAAVTHARSRISMREVAFGPCAERSLCEAPAVLGRRFASDLAKGGGK